MKKKIKLRNLTKEQWDTNRVSLCKLDKGENCDKCIFQWVGCDDSILRSSWINHKEMYSDKFLNQEVEIEAPDILDKVEKEYLSNVIKPFKHRVISIEKLGCINNKYFIGIKINSKLVDYGEEYLSLPFFQNKMYQGMEPDKEYTLAELGLFQENTKITLTEFWNSKEKLAIHCNTEEKAIKLLKVFDKMDKRWSTGDRYSKNNYWNEYEKDTCYNNGNQYSPIYYFKSNNYKVYEFEDVDFEDLEK